MNPFFGGTAEVLKHFEKSNIGSKFGNFTKFSDIVRCLMSKMPELAEKYPYSVFERAAYVLVKNGKISLTEGADKIYKAKVGNKWLKGKSFVKNASDADTFESETEPKQRINQMKKDGKLDKKDKIIIKSMKENWGDYNNGEYAIDPDFDKGYIRPDPDFDMKGRRDQIAYCLDDIGTHYVDKADAYKMYIENCGLRQEEAKKHAEKFEDKAPDHRFYNNGKLDQFKLITYFDNVYILDWPLFDIEANRSDEDINGYCGPKEYIRRLLDDAKNDDVDLTNEQAISNTIEAYDTLIYDTLYGESLSNIEDDLKEYATDKYPHIKRAYAIICDWKKELADVEKGKFTEARSNGKWFSVQS